MAQKSEPGTVIRTWEGLNEVDLDALTDIDFYAAYLHLKSALPPQVQLRGLCPVSGAKDLHWAALAWSAGIVWRGLGTTPLDAVVALTNLIEHEATPEQASSPQG